jgi:lipopolysaccharide heptosyltransferase II
MNLLIIKLGATGDVVRTTPLMHRFSGCVTWITEAKNKPLLEGVRDNLRCLSWADRNEALDLRYDLAINLEDTMDAALFLKSVRCNEIFGAYSDSANLLRYTKNSACWFDLSLISGYGKEEADRLKFLNRRTYQDMIFAGLGFRFAGETYFLPQPIETGLSGDVAIAADSGPVWPMKKWAHYAELKHKLEGEGLRVNVLPTRSSLLEHLADVRNHRCLVGGDSLPMHFALGTETHCVTLFTCTSPWEIYEYGIQRKILSRRLGEFFYQRGYDERATSAIPLAEVKDAVMAQLQSRKPARTLSNAALS